MGELNPTEDLQTGQLIGPYRIERRLGAGGMGIVYQAVHQSLGQSVAIKVLRRNFSGDNKALHRFFNEARAISIVQHPGLVQIHDYQQTDSGSAYIVMEFLRGTSLEDRLRAAVKQGSGLPTKTVLQLGSQLAAALYAAHAASVVHCDLKPENIFLLADSEVEGGERVKILDFGIAKFLADSGGKQTTVGLILGTPKYMSPEQCEGRESLSDKVDVYALGAILYEMLSGAPPFDAQSSSALMRQHMMREPDSLHERLPTIPLGLTTLVHEMLAKTAHERPSMAQVQSRLQSLKAQPEATGDGKPGQLRAILSGLRRHPIWVRRLLFGTLILVVAGGGSGLLLSKLRHRAEPRSMGAAPANQLAASPELEAEAHENASSHTLVPEDRTHQTPDHGLKADKLRKHKLGKPLLKETSAALKSSAEPAAVKNPTLPDPATPKHSKVTNVEIEPDR